MVDNAPDERLSELLNRNLDEPITDRALTCECPKCSWAGSAFEAAFRVQSSQTRYSCPECGEPLATIHHQSGTTDKTLQMHVEFTVDPKQQ